MKPNEILSPATKPKKKKSPPGPGLKVGAFIELMRRLAAIKEQLSNEQVQFVQNAIQRFEYETEGHVKTKHAVPKAKKTKRSSPPAINIEPRPPSIATKGFIERLVKLVNENEVLLEIEHLSPADAERIAREQGLRAHSPEVARAKLAETIITLREIERIAGAGTKAG